jgi:hypothetical protein
MTEHRDGSGAGVVEIPQFNGNNVREFHAAHVRLMDTVYTSPCFFFLNQNKTGRFFF